MKISLCMIVKDEEEVLGRCLDSVKDLVDEIVIADTGSTDDTLDIAKRYTDRVYEYEWRDDFAAARNFAFAKGKGDYLFWLDADDYISPENAVLFRELRKKLEKESPDMVMCPYDTAFDENGATRSTFYRERLVKKNAGFDWQGRVHECIAPHGKILHDNFRVFHLGSRKERGMRNLHIYQKWAGEEKLGGRDLFYYGRELYYHRLFTEAIAVICEMLEGNGWYVNKIEACKILAYCRTERGEYELAKTALLQSFLYGEPRASVCCEIANLFKRENRLHEAAFWYDTALNCTDHTEEGDFEEPACRGFVPLLELTCCYYALGDKSRAIQCHKKTEEIDPQNPSVLHNRSFFTEKGLL